jgi:hypothetical protein
MLELEIVFQVFACFLAILSLSVQDLPDPRTILFPLPKLMLLPWKMFVWDVWALL